MTQHVHVNNFYQHEFLPELGREGHFIVKDEFVGHSFGVFTSGGDAQGIRKRMIHLLPPMLYVCCSPLKFDQIYSNDMFYISRNESSCSSDRSYGHLFGLQSLFYS